VCDPYTLSFQRITDCSMIILSLFTWSMQERRGINSACSFLIPFSRTSIIPVKMILQKTLLASERILIPLQFCFDLSGRLHPEILLEKHLSQTARLQNRKSNFRKVNQKTTQKNNKFQTNRNQRIFKFYFLIPYSKKKSGKF
jgi:hypothetical protein